jgi:hypothetical protein
MGKTGEGKHRKRIFAGFIAGRDILYVVGMKSGKGLGTLLTDGVIAAFFLPVWTGSYSLWKTSVTSVWTVWKSERSVSLVLAVMILAETGIHGVFSITDNGTANRDVYAESEQGSDQSY